MSTTAGATVVVGVDGSACSLAAVRAAAVEAVERGRSLRIVHAFIWPSLGVTFGLANHGPSIIALRDAAELVLAGAVTTAEKAAPGVVAIPALLDGAPAEVLQQESRHAVLLVVGDRGLSGFGSLLLGSVALHLTAHAACPVLVVRGEESAAGPIVVGVDGSAASTLAIGFAMEEATRRHATLIALHAWNSPISTGMGDMLPLVYAPDALEDGERRLLSESMAGWSERFPDVVTQPRLTHGQPAPVLIEASRSAQLVVLGARGHGGFAGLLLGSVSQTVMHHATCPVAVVRATQPAA